MSADPFEDLEHETQLLVVEFVRAETDITRVTLDALLDARIGSRGFRRKRLALVAEITDKLKAAAIPGARRLVRKAYRRGVKTARIAVEPPPGQIQREAVQTLADGLEGRIVAATDTVGRRVDDVFRRVGLQIASAQLTDERTLEAAVRSMTTKLRRQGVTSFVDRTGREWGLERYAEMAIRTTVAESVFEGTETAMLARGFDLITINLTDNPCPLCVPINGKTFSLTGATEGVEVLPRPFPPHPRCVHHGAPAVGAAARRVAVAA